jgi:hypothetical protein
MAGAGRVQGRLSIPRLCEFLLQVYLQLLWYSTPTGGTHDDCLEPGAGPWGSRREEGGEETSEKPQRSNKMV